MADVPCFHLSMWGRMHMQGMRAIVRRFFDDTNGNPDFGDFLYWVYLDSEREANWVAVTEEVCRDLQGDDEAISDQYDIILIDLVFNYEHEEWRRRKILMKTLEVEERQPQPPKGRSTSMDNLNEKREAALDRAFARQFNDGIWIGVDFVGSYVRQQVRCQACRRYEFCDDRLTATLNDGANPVRLPLSRVPQTRPAGRGASPASARGGDLRAVGEPIHIG